MSTSTANAPRHAVVIASGGPDSTAGAYRLADQGSRLTLLSCDYGQRHREELRHAARVAELLRTTKAGIVRQAAALGVPFELTWSCCLGRDRPCGTCGTSTERRESFALAGVDDPTAYAQRPPLALWDATHRLHGDLDT